MSAPEDEDPVRVRLFGRAGCHLCDQARAVVSAECARADVSWQEVSIDDDATLRERYWDLIPVVEVDGEHFEALRVDPARLRARLGAGRRRRWLW